MDDKSQTQASELQPDKGSVQTVTVQPEQMPVTDPNLHPDNQREIFSRPIEEVEQTRTGPALSPLERRNPGFTERRSPDQLMVSADRSDRTIADELDDMAVHYPLTASLLRDLQRIKHKWFALD